MSIQRLSNSGQSGYRYKTLIAGITPVASVPTVGTATALTFSTASVTFTAPGAYAGVTFTATSSPGGLTGTSATSPITVSGLSEQTAYTFTVTATNATGTSSPSAASNSVTTPQAWAPEGAYDSLATVTVPSGGLASVTFAGIPSGYKHLELRIFAKTDRATFGEDLIWGRFNGDTGANYTYHYLNGDGSTATAGGATSSSSGFYAGESTASGTTGFGATILTILDYANTSKNKTTRTLTGIDFNGTVAGYGGQITLTSGLWQSTYAITSINLRPNAGTQYIQHSQFALYGVK